jgi:hypothetical protein
MLSYFVYRCAENSKNLKILIKPQSGLPKQGDFLGLWGIRGILKVSLIEHCQ